MAKTYKLALTERELQIVSSLVARRLDELRALLLTARDPKERAFCEEAIPEYLRVLQHCDATGDDTPDDGARVAPPGLEWEGPLPQSRSPRDVSGDRVMRYEGRLDGQLVAVIESTGYRGKRAFGLQCLIDGLAVDVCSGATVDELRERAHKECVK